MSDISGISAAGSAGVPIPADVRKAGTDAEQTYRVALGFERQLLEQLTKTMSQGMTGSAAGGDDGEDSGASAGTSAYKDMLPGTLADAVTGAGGLGLAHDLFLSMRGAAS